jgi:hypothetical protein
VLCLGLWDQGCCFVVFESLSVGIQLWLVVEGFLERSVGMFSIQGFRGVQGLTELLRLN